MRAKRFLSVLMILAMMTTLFPAAAAAADSIIHDIEAGPIIISDDGSYIIKGTGQSTANTITVAAGASPHITLEGVNIDSNGCAFLIADDSTGNVRINLEGDNTLRSAGNYAGLQKNGSGVGVGTLTIDGTGSLTATGGYCSAGIGGSDGAHCSNITINGGAVIASGGMYGAGIGGGYGGDSGGSSSNITINGGRVTATGGDCSAGIGGGDYGSGSNITIDGGEVSATGGYYSGAGIGGGYNGSGSNISINGGAIIASGGEYGAGIGGGDGGSGSYITISGGMVTADGGTNASGIGAGFSGTAFSNMISPVEGKQITVMAGDTKPPETIVGLCTVETLYTRSDQYFYSYEDRILDTSAIDTAIAAANAAKAGVVVSADGKDVAPGTFWATPAISETLDEAIETAATAKDTVTTDEEVMAAVAALDAAIAAYNAAKADGTKEEIFAPVTPLEASDIAKVILSAAGVQKNHTVGKGKGSRKINFISEVACHMGPGTDFESNGVPVPKAIWVGAEGAQVETMNPDYWAAVLCYLNKLIDNNPWLGLHYFSYSYDNFVDDL